MKYIYFTSILILILSCTKKNNEKISLHFPPADFCGYGIAVFSKSTAGSIRYMEFYPILYSTNLDTELEKRITISVKNGLVLRVTADCILWKNLVASNHTQSDQYGFYKSLIFIDLRNSRQKYNYDRPIPNEIILGKKIFITKTFDYGGSELTKVQMFKILKTL